MPCRFVPNFSKVTAPLNKKLQKDGFMTLLSLTKAKMESVESPDIVLKNPPILASRRATVQYSVDIDACDSQVGFILLQNKKYALYGKLNTIYAHLRVPNRSGQRCPRNAWL